MKEELSLDQFGGRSWAGLHRHAFMTISAPCLPSTSASRRRSKAKEPDPQGHHGRPCQQCNAGWSSCSAAHGSTAHTAAPTSPGAYLLKWQGSGSSHSQGGCCFQPLDQVRHRKQPARSKVKARFGGCDLQPPEFAMDVDGCQVPVAHVPLMEFGAVHAPDARDNATSADPKNLSCPFRVVAGATPLKPAQKRKSTLSEPPWLATLPENSPSY